MKFINFIKRIFMSAFNTIKGLFKEVIGNIEAVTILSFSAIGLTTVLSELPFHYTLPVFIDAPMVIPVLSVLVIMLLVTIMQRRLSYAEGNI